MSPVTEFTLCFALGEWILIGYLIVFGVVP
jgi:hypothetical protein